MGEKNNGRRLYQRPNHGTEHRGVFSTPSISMVGYQRDQARLDKEALLKRLKERYQARLEVSTGIGNQELPAYRHKAEIVDAINANKAIILGGETGSGKSTQVPQYLLEEGYDKVYVLVPRRVISNNLVDRIRDELQPHIGEVTETVGVVHGERVELSDNNRIVIMTADTFNAMLPDIEAQHSDKKVAIISDEIHEANLFTEIATGLAAIAVQEHDDWHLVASSATHNVSTLTSQFARINGTTEEDVPIVTIEGRPHSVERKEAPNQTPMEVYAGFDTRPDKTMIFTSGKREISYVIEKTRMAMEAREKGSSANVIFRKLHGELTEAELLHINDPIPEGYKLAIVASPAGMSGITIPGITHVITDGTINRPELDNDGVSGLRRHYLSRAGIMQQIGRAARDVGGGIGIIAKPITIDEDKSKGYYKDEDSYTMDFKSYDDSDRLDHEPAEIYHSNLASVVLRLAALNRRFDEINDYIPHKVAPSAIVSAEQALARLGALDEDGNITKIGKLMNSFPVNPELSRGLAEAAINSRPIQHMAHMAIIAAAVEQGGLQDFSNNRSTRWQRLIRPSTDDDFIAQLDITLGMVEGITEHGPEYERYGVYENDLHPKKVELARKITRKIMRILNVDLDNLVLMPPRYDDEALIRRDFTAGMIELVYEPTSSRNKKHYYRNIHGDSESTERYVSRSVTTPEEGALIAGFPRWFEKKLPRGKVQHNDVVEQILKVNEADIVHFAMQHGSVSSRPLPPKLVGDQVLEQIQPAFGSIDVGKPIAAEREFIPERTQQLIVRSALENQGAAQRALRSVIEELQYYHDIIPPDELDAYKKTGAPEEITSALIEGLLRDYAKETRSISHIDRKIAYYVYSKGIGINRYYDDDARVEMRARSPRYIRIGDSDCELWYHQGRPYVTKLSREQQKVADRGVYLPDGREVYIRMAGKSAELRLIPLNAE